MIKTVKFIEEKRSALVKLTVANELNKTIIEDAKNVNFARFMIGGSYPGNGYNLGEFKIKMNKEEIEYLKYSLEKKIGENNPIIEVELNNVKDQEYFCIEKINRYLNSNHRLYLSNIVDNHFKKLVKIFEKKCDSFTHLFTNRVLRCSNSENTQNIKKSPRENKISFDYIIRNISEQNYIIINDGHTAKVELIMLKKNPDISMVSIEMRGEDNICSARIKQAYYNLLTKIYDTKLYERRERK